MPTRDELIEELKRDYAANDVLAAYFLTVDDVIEYVAEYHDVQITTDDAEIIVNEAHNHDSVGEYGLSTGTVDAVVQDYEYQYPVKYLPTCNWCRYTFAKAGALAGGFHEKGCPNDGKEWNETEGRWVTPEREEIDWDEPCEEVDCD